MFLFVKIKNKIIIINHVILFNFLWKQFKILNYSNYGIKTAINREKCTN